MKKALTKVMLVALMAILPLSFYAQKKQNKPVEKYFYIFAEGGLSVNHTDLANYGFVPFYQDGKFLWNDGYVFNNFDGKVGVGYQFGKVVGLNAKFGTATLGGKKLGQDLMPIGADDDVYLRDLELDKTTFMEGNLNLTFNFFNLFFGYNPRRVFNFNPHIGVGAIRYHAGQVNVINGNELLPKKEEAAMALTVPVGAELNFNISRMLDFFIDYNYTFAVLSLKGERAADGLDQVQKNPDDIQVVNDMYSSVNAGLRLKFNQKRANIDNMCPPCIDINTNPAKLEEKDGKVSFDIIYSIPAEFFEKEAVMCIVPTFTYPNGQIEFDPVVLVGENVNGGTYQVNYKKGGEYTKHYSIDFVPDTEMEKGKLTTSALTYIYGGKLYGTHEEIMKNVEFKECCNNTIADGITYVAPLPPVEPPVVITEYDTVKIFFPYYSSDWKEGKRVKDNKKGIVEDFSKNKTAMEYANNKLNESQNVKEVRIVGWASPEGEHSLNQGLSGDRGTTVKDKLTYGNAKVQGMGRDWNGFFELVEKSSDLNNKDKELLMGIKHINGDDEKEAELQRRVASKPSLKSKLDKYIFPHQRRVDIIIVEEHTEKK